MSDDLLADYPITLDVPVAWGDMDAFGHVNNTIYFRYFESARIMYLRAIDFTAGGGGAGGGGAGGSIGPILASTHCRFRRPLAYPDTVRVGTRTTEVADDRFTMEYRVVSLEAGAVAAEGGGVVVAYDYGRGEKADLPAPVRAAIEELGQ